MNLRPLLVLLAALSAAALLLGAARADAASFLGALDATTTPDGYACEDTCTPGASMGFRQFALRTATVEAPEAGVLVAATVQAKRFAGTESPRMAVLRPDRDGVNLSVVATAPVEVTDPEGAVTRVE